MEALGEDKAALREILLQQHIHSLIVAPLWRAGRLIGFAGIDNPKRAFDQLQHLNALADYNSLLLARRDLLRERIPRQSLPDGQPDSPVT